MITKDTVFNWWFWSDEDGRTVCFAESEQIINKISPIGNLSRIRWEDWGGPAAAPNPKDRTLKALTHREFTNNIHTYILNNQDIIYFIFNNKLEVVEFSDYIIAVTYLLLIKD